MRTKIIVAAGAVLFAAAVVASIYENDGKIKGDQLLLNEVEALASGESSGDVIKCYCSAWYQTGNNVCSADGKDNDAVCAQSQPGGNILCSDYNGNCRG